MQKKSFNAKLLHKRIDCFVETLILSKTALLQVENQVVLHKEVENYLEMFKLSLSIHTCSQNIIQIEEDVS